MPCNLHFYAYLEGHHVTVVDWSADRHCGSPPLDPSGDGVTDVLSIDGLPVAARPEFS
jgi:hypothetical protein